MTKSKIARWLNLAVFGANDGIVTTFAVVAGVAGAKLSSNIVLVLGLANIAADALSMSLGNYLGEKSENRANQDEEKNKEVVTNSLIMFISFLFAGLIPLIPYFVHFVGSIPASGKQFTVSSIATALGLFIIGAARTKIIKGSWIKNGLEMLMVGSIAAVVAYATGSFLETIVH